MTHIFIVLLLVVLMVPFIYYVITFRERGSKNLMFCWFLLHLCLHNDGRGQKMKFLLTFSSLCFNKLLRGGDKKSLKLCLRNVWMTPVLCLDGRGFVLQVTKSNWQPSFDAKLHRRSQQCKVWKYFTAFSLFWYLFFLSEFFENVWKRLFIHLL